MARKLRLLLLLRRLLTLFKPWKLVLSDFLTFISFLSCLIIYSSCFDSERRFLEHELQRRIKAAQSMWGLDFYVNDAEIAPLRGALAVWGLTVDDLDVSVFVWLDLVEPLTVGD